MKPGLYISALSAIFGIALMVPASASAQQTQPQQQPAAVPDAPAPQGPIPLSNVAGGPIRPGGGAGTETKAGSGSGDVQQPDQPPQQPAPPPVKPAPQQTTPPEFLNAEEIGQRLIIYTTEVEVPVTVKDNKGKLVPGLTWRDFKVYENGNYEPLKVFSVDSTSMSIVYVVDQSLRRDQMEQVNDSMGAIQGGLTASDEISVFTYSNGAQDRSGSFTGAQSARVPFLLAMTKSSGDDQQNVSNSGPLAGCPIRVNGNCADPNIQPGRSTGNDTFITIPKEIHTLNDAILAAARQLSTRPKGRRRVIYVISDGKEAGSKARYGEVLKYLQTNNIEVYGTLVGDAALWGEGRLSRVHLPFTMYENLLVKYTIATGGTLDSEHGVNNIEKSYAALALEARNQYTLVYASHEPPLDGKYRRIDVRVDRPNLEVAAKAGYWPTPTDQQQ